MVQSVVSEIFEGVGGEERAAEGRPLLCWMKFWGSVFGYALRIVYFTYEKECSFLVLQQETNQRNALKRTNLRFAS